MGDQSPMELNGWKSTIIDAAIRQGPSFVILLLILYGIWSFGNYAITTAVPAHLQQIQEGYQKIQESHTKNLDRVITAVENDQETMRASQQLMKQAVEELKTIRKKMDYP